VITPIIVTQDLWRIYRLGNLEIPALRGLNLTVLPGDFVVMRGRSGSGKTTLMNCLGGLDQPTSGKISVCGADLNQLAAGAQSDQHLTNWRRENIGLVFQSFGLLPSLSAYENVELILRITGQSYSSRRKRANECLDLVGLADLGSHRPYELSGGQQQRVAIARALATRPRLLLADEPTAELDSATSRDILALFQKLVREEGLTLLMTSHDSLVDEYASRLLHLLDGQIKYESSQADPPLKQVNP
jgi:ABC-type lipoprotein export system ATPase subunit